MDNFGCRFSLYPMTDNFIPVILGSLEKNDSSAVYSYTDAISTVYQGAQDSVTDAVKGLFINAFTDGVHMAVEGQFSNLETAPEKPRKDGTPNRENIKDIHFPVKCKLSVYTDEKGARAYEKAKAECGIEKQEISYGTRFGGDVQDVWNFIESAMTALTAAGAPFTVHFTMNCNSPTRE